jgi:hypothetical protein
MLSKSKIPIKLKAQPYYGQIKCQKENCKNKAYYQLDNSYLCGVHSKNKEKRVELPKMSASQKVEEKKSLEALSKELIEEARKKNLIEGQLGSVIVTKLYMMKEPEHHSGFLKVFPNFKHQNRTDGFGCSSLSPMSLGPVDHGQPNLPMAKNIENFHQSSKCYQEEVDKDGSPTSLYYENRLKYYLDKEPHRHKYIGKDKKNKNIPLYFIWLDKNMKEHRLSYVESRQFYCAFYERLASKQSLYILFGLIKI